MIAGENKSQNQVFSHVVKSEVIPFGTRGRLYLKSQNSRPHLYHEGIFFTVKHAGDSLVLRGRSAIEGTGNSVRVFRKMDGAKYRAPLEENLLEAAKRLQLGQVFNF